MYRSQRDPHLAPPSGDVALVELSGVSRVYETARGELRALDDVSLEIGRGEFVCVTGPSGSGKSTLLHVLGLLDRPTSGGYRFGGEDVVHLDDDGRARRRNREIGFVFQAFHLVPHLTVAGNVELPLAYRGVAPADRRRRAADALSRVGLETRREHLPDELSGGEQQRTAIARALVAEPELLLADEPTGNLDERSAASVLDLLLEIHRGGTTFVVVTHNRRVAAAASRGYEMSGGRLGADMCAR